GEVLGDPVVDAVEPALVEAGKVERGLSQRLRRNRARVDAGPADLGGLLDDGDTLAEVRRLGRALFAGRSGPDHDQVVVRHAPRRSEEHTSELQSRENLVCRLLLEKKKKKNKTKTKYKNI